VPFRIDEARLAQMVAAFDLDLGRSLVAWEGEEKVGLANLGLRGERTWLGGVGVVKAARRRGIGEQLTRALFDQARDAGAREMVLEVIVQNEPAIALYDKLGFVTIRDVEVWTLEQRAPRQHDVRPVPLEQARARIARERRQREPWQRADESVAHYEDVEALESDRGAVLFKRSGERASLLQGVAADEHGARELLEGLPAEATALHWLNGPEGDPFNAAIASLGGTRAWTQHEMRLGL
jgi:acetyltransferase (GNAT) family protein